MKANNSYYSGAYGKSKPVYILENEEDVFHSKDMDRKNKHSKHDIVYANNTDVIEVYDAENKHSKHDIVYANNNDVTYEAENDDYMYRSDNNDRYYDDDDDDEPIEDKDHHHHHHQHHQHHHHRRHNYSIDELSNDTDTLREFDRNNNSYSNGVNMKFEIVHNVDNSKHIQNDKTYEAKQKTKNEIETQNKRNLKTERKFEISDKTNNDLATEKPSHKFVVILLHSFPLQKDEMLHIEKSEKTLNQYIKKCQKQASEMKGLSKPRPTDNAYYLYLFSNYLTLSSMENDQLVRLHSVENIIVWGYSMDKKSHVFAYSHRERDLGTCWLFYTFEPSHVVSEAFRTIYLNKNISRNSDQTQMYNSNEELLYKKQSRGQKQTNNSLLQIEEEFPEEYEPNNRHYVKAERNIRQANSDNRKQPAQDRTEWKYGVQKNAFYGGQKNGTYAARSPPRDAEQNKIIYSVPNKVPREMSFNGSREVPLNVPRQRQNNYGPQLDTSFRREAVPTRNAYGAEHEDRNRVYSSNREIVPLQYFDDYEGNRKERMYSYNSDVDYISPRSKKQAGRVNRGYADKGDMIDERLHALEIHTITTIPCKYIGCMIINKLPDTDVAQRMAERIKSSTTSNRWVTARTEITSSRINVYKPNGETVFGSLLTNLVYYGSLPSNNRFAVLIIQEAIGRVRCHVFYTEPNCYHLLKTLKTAHLDKKLTSNEAYYDQSL